MARNPRVKKAPVEAVGTPYPNARAIQQAHPRNLTELDEAKFGQFFDRYGAFSDAGKAAIEEIVSTVQEHGPELNRVCQELLTTILPSLDLPEDQKGRLTAYCLSIIDRSGTLISRTSLALSLLSYQKMGERKFAARRNSARRLAADPKAQAKSKALELWKERHAGNHPRLRRVQDFAVEVMKRWPVLTNSKTIEGWSAKWTKQAREGKNPTC
jgi:hypothetical protein